MLRVNLQNWCVKLRKLVRQINLSNAKQRLAVFYRLPVLDVNLRNRSVILAFDFVHQLHGFYDCEGLAFFHGIAYGYEWRCVFGRCCVKGADQR